MNRKVLTITSRAAAIAALLIGLASGAAAQQAAPVDTSSIAAVVTASYQIDPVSPPVTVTSNTATLELQNNAGLLLSPVFKMQMINMPKPVYYPVTLQNTGSISDTYRINFYHSYGWTVSLIEDNIASGVWQASDTTPLPYSLTLAPGQTESFFIAMSPPPWRRASNGEALLLARSTVSPALYADVMRFSCYRP